MGATLDWTPFAPSSAARKAGAPVARIVELVGPGMQPEGFATGFLIASRLLLTNHHVFPTAADVVGTGANFFFERTEHGVTDGVVFRLDPDLFYLSDEALDFAIVGVEADVQSAHSLDDLGVITLIEATPKILRGQPVHIIQYPEGGPKQYAISQNRLVDVLEKEGFLHYETDTLGGSSGSPAFSERWELIALHHASIPEIRDGKIIAVDGAEWNEDMGDDRVHWVANEGIRVSAIVGRLANTTLSDPRRQALLEELMETTTDPVDELPPPTSFPAAPAPDSVAMISASHVTREATMANNQFNFTGPVSVHVYAPMQAPASPPMLAPAAIKPIEAQPPLLEATIRFDPNYRDREGYDPAFLDPEGRIRVPAPTVAANRMGEMLTGREGKPVVLKYHHFELAMNERRRLQMWSAVNIDYDPVKKPAGNRESFGTDKWIPDERIPAAAQIFDADFYKPAGNIDRGHIVRREDNAWGDSETEIEFANSDTFHWTNCSPQHEAFNQSNPARSDPAYRGMRGLWGDFENYIQQSRKADDTKCCILAGPVLDDNDPSKDFGTGEIQYPLLFWKVVCVAEPRDGGAATDKELKAYGFMLSQKPVVDRFGIEVFGPGRFKRYQVPLKMITQRTGVVFDHSLYTADPMNDATEALRISGDEQIRGVPGRQPAPADVEFPTP